MSSDLTFGLKKDPSNKQRQLPVIETGQSSILPMQPKEVHIIGLQVIHKSGSLGVNHHAKVEKSQQRHSSDLFSSHLQHPVELEADSKCCKELDCLIGRECLVIRVKNI